MSEATRRRSEKNVRMKGCLSGSALGILATVCCALCLVLSADGAYELCTENLLTVEDGVCDSSNNVASCEYDGGDCCPSTCSSSTESCTQETRQCLNPAADDYPYTQYENCTAVSGVLPYIEDGVCDAVNNNVECGFDGGDCCPSTCVSSASSFCPEDNRSCVNPLAVDFGYPGYENCTGWLPEMGDGRCDDKNNNAECGYDGGDCCEYSCQPGEFACVGQFDCLDPTMNDTEWLTTSSACSADLPRDWVVEDTASATVLANVINCTGGTFNVEWRGYVNVTQSFRISELTVVNITGVTGVGMDASPAIADGNGEIRIFAVLNATLHLNGMTLTQGYAYAGGAVFVFRGTVTFSGESSIVNNAAGAIGGAMFVHGGVVSWDGNMTVADNSCASNGGAFILRYGSSLSWSGNTTFFGNRIGSFGQGGGSSFGGAIYAEEDSNVSWSGDTRFIGNSVDVGDIGREVMCYGGAVAVSADSEATWSGRTMFVDNHAGFCGGALYANDTGTISWTGETVFSTNRATRGGAVCVEWFSNASWSGPTAFVGNNGSANGGAVYATDLSSVAWSGSTAFEGNGAQDGGAVHVSGASALAWQGETTFERNEASGSGGGLFIGDGGEVSCSGRTEFVENHAELNGGALVSALDSAMDDVAASISVSGSVLFFNNSCQNYGGALMVSGPVSLTFWSENVQFEANTAESAGGAVCLTGIGTGPIFRRAIFASNSAQIGGAVYSTGSGTSISPIGEEFPVTYAECTFTGNTAATSGGAVESAAGKDFFANSTFVSNLAGQGGAMTLAGSVSLSGCAFVGNRADPGGGPAISNVGFTESVESCSFSANEVYCGESTFLDYFEGDRYRSVCSGCEACNDCNVDNSTAIPICANELDHTHSKGDNVTLETLLIEGGYWRATPSSDVILACHNTRACLGGQTGAPDFCAVGYEGPYCAVCSAGHAESLSYTCSCCSTRRATVTALVAIPTIVTLGVMFLWYMVLDERKAGPASQRHRLKQLFPLQPLKIVIVVLQILTEVASVANITFPDVYERFLEGADALNFDMGWLLSAGCFVHLNFHARVITSTVGPIAALAVLGLTYAVAWSRNRSKSQALQKVRRKHLSAALWVTFLVYSSVSSTVFKMFSCETLADGKTYLRADYSIECDSSKHQAMQFYAAVMIFVYPLGIPLIYAALLFWGRDALKIAATPNTDVPRIQAAAHLSSPYRPGCFYYEVVECGRRVLLTGVIVFISPDDLGHIAVTLVIACTFALVFEALAPYSSRWDTWISRSGHVVVLLSIFVGFLLKQNVFNEARGRQNLYGGILLAINVTMIFAVAVEGVTMTCSVTRAPEVLSRSVSRAAVGFDVERSGEGSSGRRSFGTDDNVDKNCAQDGRAAGTTKIFHSFHPGGVGGSAVQCRPGFVSRNNGGFCSAKVSAMQVAPKHHVVKETNR